MNSELAMPPNAHVVLRRIGATDHFHVSIETFPGDSAEVESLAEIIHKDADLWKAIAMHYHTKRTRAELDGQLW